MEITAARLCSWWPGASRPRARTRNCKLRCIQQQQQQQQQQRSVFFDWNSAWYPVAIEADLDKRMPHAVTILGYDLVLWWDGAGKSWQVFNDKCPHRLAPLSEGRIAENGHLQCSYHGWTFAPGNGSCSGIPQANPEAQSKFAASPKACAAVYPSMEQQGILWFSLDPAANAHKPPSFPVLDDASFCYYWGTSDLPYGYEALTENLVDPTHVPFAHHRLQGNRNSAGPVSYTVSEVDISGFTGSTGRGGAVFMPPCSFVMDFAIPPKKPEAGGGEKTKKLYTVFMCVPVAPGRSKVFWSFPRNFARWLSFVTPMWVGHLRHMLVLDSDLYLLHVMEKKQRVNDACYTPTSADAFVLAFRRWLSLYSGGSPRYAKHVDPQIPPSPPKRQLMDRYQNHVKHCPVCMRALKFFKLAEIGLQVAAVGALGLASANAARSFRLHLVFAAMLLWLASRWTGHFVDKSYHFHDYNHALVK